MAARGEEMNQHAKKLYAWARHRPILGTAIGIFLVFLLPALCLLGLVGGIIGIIALCMTL